MPYRKNLITYLIISVSLVVLAVVAQLFLHETISVFIVAILVGAATGIVATMVSCYFENNYKLELEILSFEKLVCRILGNVFSIATLDINGNYIITETKKHIDEINKSFYNLNDVIDNMNYLLISKRKEKKLQNIVNELNNLFTFILWDYNSPKKIERYGKDNIEEVQMFETLKAIKYMKNFNADSILQYLQKSKNNKMKYIADKDSFFHIIFESCLSDEEQKEKRDKYQREEVKELENLYKKYNIETVKEHVRNIEVPKWDFSTRIGGKTKKRKKS